MSQSLTSAADNKLMIAKTITEHYLPLRRCRPGGCRFRQWAYGIQIDQDGRRFLLQECTKCDSFRTTEIYQQNQEIVAP